MLAADGTIYEGANVENDSYGLSICAERVAIFKAVNDRRAKLRAVAVCAGPGKVAHAPCGACLQVMSQFEIGTIVLVPRAGRPEVLSLTPDFLPRPFRLRRKRSASV